MINWLYRWLPIIFGCHCRDDRTFHFKGKKFPICARCTGELVGIIFSLFSCFFFRSTVTVSVILLMPMLIDGFVQLLTPYESNNFKRFFTGLLFGYGFFNLFIISTIYTFNFGRHFTENLK